MNTFDDDATVGRIFTRREALLTAARAGVALAAGGWMTRRARADAAPTTRPRMPLVASPRLTEGPFFVDEKLNRSDLASGTTRPSVVNGLPLSIAFTLYKLSGSTYAPLRDAQIDVWHADTAGVYSDESNPMNHEDTERQTWLRGYQITNADGAAEFRTIFPGWYPGRTPHIHFKVRQLIRDGQSTAEFTSQVFFREADLDRIYSSAPYNATRGRRDTTNADDGVFNEVLPDGSTAGSYMLLDLKADPKRRSYTTSFPILLTDASLGPRPHGRRGPGGPGSGGPPGPPPDDH